MKQRAFVIGDVHGMNDSMNIMLKQWSPEDEQLILLGDLIDRGPDSKETLLTAKSLVERGAICLRGNHEDMLLNFLHNPEAEGERYVKRNGGVTTIAQLLNLAQERVLEMSFTEMRDEVVTQYDWLEQWLTERTDYVEFGEFVCVHAGVDLTLEDWRQTSHRDFVWIREPFHEGVNTTGKYIVFGHTPVQYLHSDPTIWQYDGKIGIDGGAVYGGQLFAVRITSKTLVSVVTVKDNNVMEKEF